MTMSGRQWPLARRAHRAGLPTLWGHGAPRTGRRMRPVAKAWRGRL